VLQDEDSPDENEGEHVAQRQEKRFDFQDFVRDNSRTEQPILVRAAALVPHTREDSPHAMAAAACGR
jgi:hypothetical protein